MSFYSRGFGNVSIPGMNTSIVGRTIAPPSSDAVIASADLANQLKAMSLVSQGLADSVTYRAPAALPPAPLSTDASGFISDQYGPPGPPPGTGQSQGAAMANPASSSMLLIVAAAVLVPVAIIGVVMATRKRSPAMAGRRHRRRRSRR